MLLVEALVDLNERLCCTFVVFYAELEGIFIVFVFFVDFRLLR